MNSNYKYTKLDEVVTDKTCHVIGVIKFAKPPKQSKRGIHVCLSITDETIFMTRTSKIIANLFLSEKDGIDEVGPFRIGRFHRLKIETYDGRQQAVLHPGSHFLVFDEGIGSSLQPLYKSSKNYTSVSDGEVQRIEELRAWVHETRSLFERCESFNQTSFSEVEPGLFFSNISQVVACKFDQVKSNLKSYVLHVTDGTPLVNKIHRTMPLQELLAEEEWGCPLSVLEPLIVEIRTDYILSNCLDRVKPGDFIRLKCLHAFLKDLNDSLLNFELTRNSHEVEWLDVTSPEVQRINKLLDPLRVNMDNNNNNNANTDSIFKVPHMPVLCANHCFGPPLPLKSCRSKGHVEPKVSKMVGFQVYSRSVNRKNDDNDVVDWNDDDAAAGKSADQARMAEHVDKVIDTVVRDPDDDPHKGLRNASTKLSSQVDTVDAFTQIEGDEALSICSPESGGDVNRCPHEKRSANKNSSVPREAGSSRPNTQTIFQSQFSRAQNSQNTDNSMNDIRRRWDGVVASLDTSSSCDEKDVYFRFKSQGYGGGKVGRGEEPVVTMEPSPLSTSNVAVSDELTLRTFHSSQEACSLNDVVKSTPPMNFRVKVKVLGYFPEPSLSAPFVQLHCSLCNYFQPLCCKNSQDPERKCSWTCRPVCSMAFHSDLIFCPQCHLEKKKCVMRHVYTFQLLLVDAVGTKLCVNLWGDEAKNLLGNICPRRSASVGSEMRSLKEVMDGIVGGDAECCISSTLKDGNAIYQIFDTFLSTFIGVRLSCRSGMCSVFILFGCYQVTVTGSRTPFV